MNSLFVYEGNEIVLFEFLKGGFSKESSSDEYFIELNKKYFETSIDLSLTAVIYKKEFLAEYGEKTYAIEYSYEDTGKQIQFSFTVLAEMVDTGEVMRAVPIAEEEKNDLALLAQLLAEHVLKLHNESMKEETIN